jgi:hypothetical protein
VSATICGHDRETLRWALHEWRDHEHDAKLMARGIDFLFTSRERLVAISEAGDPAKLAAIIAELLAAWPMFESWEAAGFIFIGTKANSTGYTMPQARAFALALLDSPETTAQDIERMIGEL